MNINTAKTILRTTVPLLGRSLDYGKPWVLERRVEGTLLNFVICENREHGGSYQSRECVYLTPYQARCARKIISAYV